MRRAGLALGRRSWSAPVVVAVLFVALAATSMIWVEPAVAMTSIAAPSSTRDESSTYQANATHTGSVDGTSQRPPLTERWTRDLGDVVSYPVITGGRVFVTVRGASDGLGTTLYAIDADTGLDAWAPVALPSLRTWSGLTAGGGRVFVVTNDGQLRAFDQASGHLDWSTSLPGQSSFSSEPTFRDGVVYNAGAGSGGTVYASRASDGLLLWASAVGSADHSSPAVTDELVVVGYSCQQVYALDRVTGEPRWHHDSGCSGGGGRTVVVSEGRVWAREPGTPAGLVLDEDTGEEVSTFFSDAAPAFHDGRGFFLTDSLLTARDADTLEPLWTFGGDRNLTSAPIVVGGFVYIGSSSGLLYAVDEASGALAWTVQVGAEIRRPDEHNVSEPVTGLGAGDGLLVVPATNLLVAYENLQSHLVPLSPTRLLDTRPSGPQVGYSGRTPQPGATVTLPVLGRAGVPVTGVTAVVLTVTATEAIRPGWVTVWPSGRARPPTSNLNVERAGQTISNQVVVQVGDRRSIDLLTTGGGHLVVDVAGYFEHAAVARDGRFVAVPPGRVLDTRPTAPPVGYVGPKPASGATVPIDLAGVAGVPESGVSAVALNVTITGTDRPAYATAWPSGAARPLASILNADRRGQTIAASAIVPVGPDGRVLLYTSGGTHLVVDVTGYFTDATAPASAVGLFVPVTANRIYDSRDQGVLAADQAVALSITGTRRVPPVDPLAVVANLTATRPMTSPGFLTLYAYGTDRPPTSNVNYDHPGQTIANLAISALDDGAAELYSAAESHAILDVVGYFLRTDPVPL